MRETGIIFECPGCNTTMDKMFFRKDEHTNELEATCEDCRIRELRKEARRMTRLKKAMASPHIILKSTTKERRAAGELVGIDRTRDNRRRIFDYLLTHPCVDCGETNFIDLQFDHVRGTKRGNISTMLSNACWDNIELEILKCDVRCAKCHNRRTQERSQSWRVQTQMKWPIESPHGKYEPLVPKED